MKVKVGIIDSGVNRDQFDLVTDQAQFYLQDNQLWMGEVVPDPINHGARILDVIRYHQTGCEFYIAQVFDRHHLTTAVQVAAAVDWLVEQGVQLINMSLGLRQDREPLRLAVERAVKAGVIIAAASPARGEPVYPSAYSGVLRMTGDARCAIDEISCLETEFADFGGYVKGLDQQQEAAGASMGCAHLTGHIANILVHSDDVGLTQVSSTLKHKSVYFGAEHRSA